MTDLNKAKQSFLQGLGYLESGDFCNAEKHFVEALLLAPRSLPTLANLALAQYEQGKYVEAEKTANKIIQIDTRNVEAYQMIANCFRQRDRYEEAALTCQKIIETDPTIAEAHNNLGICLSKLCKLEDAVASFLRAIELDSKSTDAILNIGGSYIKLNRLGEALAAYEKAIALRPDLAEAWLGRGNVFYNLKRYHEALAAYEKAIALRPDLAETWLGRGNAFYNLKRYDEALAAYDKAIALRPDLAQTWLGRGNVFCNLKRYDEALATYEKAIALRPDLAETWLGRGNVFYNLKRYDEALAAYEKAIALRRDLAEAWHGRGIIKIIWGNEQDGQKDCEQAVLLGANREVVDFNLARHGAIKNVPIVPRKVIEDLFDDYASYYDSHLVNELEYLGPSKLFGLILQHAEKKTLVDALDLGCGTGLMGVQLRPIVKTLVGVDLSHQMLEKAKVRAIYNELACRDIIEFTKSDTRRYDLVTSTDVFVYLGDLSVVFDAVNCRLRVGGYFAFSVEATNEGDYVLKESGRYGHTKKYLEQLGRDSGFKIHAIEDCVIRKEDKRGVRGFLALMSRLKQ
jgi:predicted TPR repeat methyltransferase